MSAPQDISVDDVARFLLAKDYELTALELFQETTEAGVAPVAVLREHFAAPATPPSATPSSSSSSQPQLLQPQQLHRSSASHSAFGGSRDFGDTSSVASAGAAASFAGDAATAKALRERDERCSLLEYELRIAKEDLDAARAQLSALKDASQKQQQQQRPQNGSTGGASVASSSSAAMTAQEGRALHFIVKRHLMAQRLNMTAITLAEELGAQDADEWAEVGIGGLAEAPDLLQIYRHFVNQAVYVPAGFRERVEALQRECAVLQRVAKEGEHTIVTLSAEKAALEKKLAEARTTIEKLQTSRARSPSLTAAAEAPSAKTSPPPPAAEAPAKEDPPSQQPPATPETTSAAATTAVPPEKPERPKKSWQDEFKQSRRDRNAVRLREKPLLESRLSLLVRRLHELEESDSGIVHVLAESLPYIVRGVILSKREELVPLFLCAVQRSDDRETRLSLTTLFFNLIKRPDEQQRSLITEGFTALAAMVGPTRTTEELLEQCIKEVGSKYEERRVLVADSCTSLAQYSNPSVRTTTILSTLLNLLQDKSSNVRASAVTNLAALVTYFTDEAKLQSLLSETARLLRDPTEIVVAATMRFLVHALIDWSDAVSRLHTGFVSFFLENIISFLKQKMRITTVLLVLVVVTGSVVLVAAIVGASVAAAAQHAFRNSRWALAAMRVDSLDYYPESLHLSLVITARASASNDTRASPKFPVAGGKVSAFLDGKSVGNGTFDSFVLKRASTFVQMTIDQAGVPLDRGDIVKRYVAGGSVEVAIAVNKMTFLFLPMTVSRDASATLSIEDTASEGAESDDTWD